VHSGSAGHSACSKIRSAGSRGSIWRAARHAIDWMRGGLVMTREELDAIGTELLTADETADARQLAAIAWRLYGEAGTAQAELERLHGKLRSIRRPTPDRC
jgi:hypothetical protein